jgi:hypothetical protein
MGTFILSRHIVTPNILLLEVASFAGRKQRPQTWRDGFRPDRAEPARTGTLFKMVA